MDYEAKAREWLFKMPEGRVAVLRHSDGSIGRIVYEDELAALLQSVAADSSLVARQNWEAEVADRQSAESACARLREALRVCHDEARAWQEGDDDSDEQALAAAEVMSMAVCKASDDATNALADPSGSRMLAVVNAAQRIMDDDLDQDESLPVNRAAWLGLREAVRAYAEEKP